jgi:SNF2 family DNA or RNA helicase
MLSEKNLHAYQKTSVAHIIENLQCGLFLDMGLGKTVSSLTAVKKLIFDLDISTALVIAPKRVAEKVWTDEVHKWKHISDLRVSVIAGSEKERIAALKKDADVYTISRDNIAWLCMYYGGSMLPFDMLIIDELSSFKSAKSIRFKALKNVRNSFSRIVGLTGTPAPNGLIDLWSQLFLLDGGQRLGKHITSYRDSYFKPDKRNGATIFSYKTAQDGEERIYAKIKDICLSMKTEDYLNMPELITHNVMLELPPKALKAYMDFEKEEVLELVKGLDETETISVANAAALSIKLLQFANGAIYREDKTHAPMHDIKLDALEDIVEAANGRPVLVAWSFRHDLMRIKERLKAYDVRELKTSQDIEDWNDGKIEVMLLHPASGGHGLNLQRGGNTLVWFGHTWSLELYQQLNKRLHRQGQTSVVNMYKLITAGTIDERVIAAQEQKAEGQNRLMDAVKDLIKKYQKP